MLSIDHLCEKNSLAELALPELARLRGNHLLVQRLFDSYSSYADKAEAPISLGDYLQCAGDLLSDGYSEEAVMQLANFLVLFPQDRPKLLGAYMAAETTIKPSITLDTWAKRQEKRHIDPAIQEEAKGHFSDMLDTVSKRRNAGRKQKKRKSPVYKQKRLYKTRIEDFYNYFDRDGLLPATTCCAFNYMLTVPDYFNQMMYVLRHLYGAVDGGYYDLHANHYSGDSIKKDSWMQAIELTFALEDLDAATVATLASPFEDEEVADFLDTRFPTIICFGLLIHNLSLFSDPECAQSLYEKRVGKIKEESGVDALQKQIRELTQKLTQSGKEVAALKKSNQALRQQMIGSSKNDVSELVHEYNQQLKEKDQKINELTDMVQRLEMEVSDISARSHQMLSDNTGYVKPWADTVLPQSGVLFAGGNQNMLKKLQKKYPDWAYVSTENAPLPTNVQIIFVMTNHVLNHGVWSRLNLFYQGREQMRYVQATNIGKLEEEMRYEYWAMMHSKSKPSE